MVNINDEITNLISMTWINSPKELLSKKYLIRFWSIDTQWMSFSEAEKLIIELIEKEWVKEIDSSISSNININTEGIVIGWQPHESIHLGLPKRDISTKKDPNNHIIKEKAIIISEEDFTNKERRLVRYISAKTGVLKEEIIRRAKRKKRSLGQITNSLCILLIAKEQGMEMNELIDAF